MRRVVEHVYCDFCGNEVREQQVTQITFAWDGQDFEVEVDASCLETLTDQPVGRVIEVAREVPKQAKGSRRRSSADITCPYPGCTCKASSERGLRRPLTQTHPGWEQEHSEYVR